MEVNINDVVSNVNVVDSNSLLTPQVLQKIVNVVLEAVREQESHHKRVHWEQNVRSGVRDQLEEA